MHSLQKKLIFYYFFKLVVIGFPLVIVDFEFLDYSG